MGWERSMLPRQVFFCTEGFYQCTSTKMELYSYPYMYSIFRTPTSTKNKPPGFPQLFVLPHHCPHKNFDRLFLQCTVDWTSEEQRIEGKSFFLLRGNFKRCQHSIILLQSTPPGSLIRTWKYCTTPTLEKSNKFSPFYFAFDSGANSATALKKRNEPWYGRLMFWSSRENGWG